MDSKGYNCSVVYSQANDRNVDSEIRQETLYTKHTTRRFNKLDRTCLHPGYMHGLTHFMQDIRNIVSSPLTEQKKNKQEIPIKKRNKEMATNEPVPSQ